MDKTRTLILIDALVVIYALAYQLQTPLEPYLVDKYAAGVNSKAAYARLQSFFGLIQLLGSLLVGALIDRFGFRVMLVGNFVACALSYAVLASATSLSGLFLSKIPTIFMAGFLCAQTAVSSLTAPGAERVAQLGRLTMAYTIGSTVGPSLGGYLGSFAATRLAVALSAVAGLLCLALPSGASDGSMRSKKKIAEEKLASMSSWLHSARDVLHLTWPLIATKFCTGLVNMAVGSVRTLTLKNVLSFDAAQLGLVMSAISLGTALASLGLGVLSQALGSGASVVRACLLGAGVLLAAQVGLFFGKSVFYFAYFFEHWGSAYIALALLLALCTVPLSTTLTALSTARVDVDKRGTLMGIEHAIWSLAALGGPPLGVYVMDAGGLLGVAVAGSAVYGALRIAWADAPVSSSPLPVKRPSRSRSRSRATSRKR